MKEIINNLQKLKNFKFSTITGLNEGEKYFLPYIFQILNKFVNAFY